MQKKVIISGIGPYSVYFCQIQRLQKTSFRTSFSPDHAGRDITSRYSQRDLSLAIRKGVLVLCLCPWMPIFQSLCSPFRRWGGSGLLLGRGLHPPASSATVSFRRANLCLLFACGHVSMGCLLFRGSASSFVCERRTSFSRMQDVRNHAT
jgi:hypothetical protein